MRRKALFSHLVALSLLVAAYGPMATYASAQSVTETKLQEMKQKATKELNRRIDTYQKTLQSLDKTVVFDGPSEMTSAVEGKSCDIATILLGMSGTALSLEGGKLKGDILLPCGLKTKVKASLQDTVKELSGLLTKVDTAKNLTQMQAIAQNIDSQYGLNQVAYVQASVTQAVSSITAVLSNLKAAYNNLHTQVMKVRECAQKEMGSSASSTSANDAGIACSDFQGSSVDVALEAQSQLDSLTSAMTSLGAVLLSTVSLLTTLTSTYSNVTNKLGGISNLGSMLSSRQLATLDAATGAANGLGNVKGILGSFTAITLQLDTANYMSSNILTSLTALGDLINVDGLTIRS